ncbi:methyl-accepting chemotaxis protein [Uliginosibacterium sp. TH139]|uniref:methyl-accepting chemotaxis protein n=1 Tax=Uliginosibacterium sp. TH139 TaxID=2067453 RepID=UPI000C7AB57E|nr:methyl-accepting chemotaxis protein [Uliginosibacterium sp. TH139]PLK49690.1 hypothetical protein C0V76_04465 [Uliginosibacterium sp. TH139]
MNLKKLSLAQQFVTVSVALSVLIIGALVIQVSLTSRASLLESMRDGLRAQVQGSRQLLENAYQISASQTDRVSNILTEAFPEGFSVDAAERMPTGKADAPVLRYKGQALNADYRAVDAFSKSTGGVATIFVRDGQDFVRATTSLKLETGERAIGTKLARDHPAYARMLAGENYLGLATLFGRNYLTKYVPVRGSDGQTNAILFVGFDLADVFTSLRSALRTGQNGDETFVAFSSGARAGNLMFHPTLEGKSLVKELPDAAGQPVFDPLLKEREGVLEYAPAGGGEHRIAVWEQSEAWGGVVVARTGDIEVYTRAGTALRNGIIIAGALAAILLSVLLWLFITRQLRPVSAVVARLQKIGEGDFSSTGSGQIDPQTRNELDIISMSLEATVRSVGSLVGELRSNAQSLTENAHGIAGAAASVAQVAASQTDAAMNAATGVQHMTESIASVTASSESAQELASRMLACADSGFTEISVVREHITRIENAVGGATAQIGKLDGDAQSISAVVSIIKEIADQTNLLALNAAIEAARAGEQGRGFAVVADEVRKLAERTGSSTQEITAMIHSIQSGARVVSSAMESAVTLVNEGVTAVERARGVIDEVQHGATAIATATQSIVGALRDQNAASGRLDAEVRHIAELSESTTDNARASSGVADQLQEMADAMSASISRFRID